MGENKYPKDITEAVSQISNHKNRVNNPNNNKKYSFFFGIKWMRNRKWDGKKERKREKKVFFAISERVDPRDLRSF